MTQTEKQTEQSKEKSDIYVDEIELIDIFRVIWKWKYLIIAGTLLGIVAAIIINSVSPKIFKINMVVRPGILNITDYKITYIDSARNLKRIIDSGAYNFEIKKRLEKGKGNAVPNDFLFNVTSPKNSDVLSISYETADVNTGLLVLETLQSTLFDQYKKLTNSYKQYYETRLKLLKVTEKKIEQLISSADKALVRIENRIKELSAEIDMINNNTITMMEELKNRGSSDQEDIPVLAQSNRIRLNQALATCYRNELDSYYIRREYEMQKLFSAEKEIAVIKQSIAKILYQNNSMENILILKSPTAISEPIRPKQKLNVIIAAGLAIFVTLFLAFLFEYIFANKVKKPKQQE